MNLGANIYVAGRRGLVGSAIVRALRRAGYKNLVLRTHAELDLTNQAQVERFSSSERPVRFCRRC
jgi:GDP-L-fucose synthase